MTDAKAIDAQYGVEKGMASFEAFILYDEMHAMTYCTMRGIEVSEGNLGFDAICAAILGDGHFLGADHTYKAMERDYHYPKLADREQPRTWAENGALDAWDRAKAKATRYWIAITLNTLMPIKMLKLELHLRSSTSRNHPIASLRIDNAQTTL